jgi:hypothetical protein
MLGLLGISILRAMLIFLGDSMSLEKRKMLRPPILIFLSRTPIMSKMRRQPGSCAIGAGMNGENGKRLERMQIMLTSDEIAALDEWRFSAHMPSRSAAVRELLRRGLAAEGYFRQSSGGSSTSFGVLDPSPPEK